MRWITSKRAYPAIQSFKYTYDMFSTWPVICWNVHDKYYYCKILVFPCVGRQSADRRGGLQKINFTFIYIHIIHGKMIITIIITINVPVVFMARYVMVLRGATSLRGIGRGGPWKSRLFWALKWHERSECYFGPKKTTYNFILYKHFSMGISFYLTFTFCFPFSVTVCFIS
jgi:hypothetical protein